MASCGCPPARCAALQYPAAWPKLVMVSALADGKLRLPTSKQYPAAWPKLVMVSALADGKLRLPTSKVRGCCSIRQRGRSW
ncbi:hypothetical protein PR002_g33224 [Phytophthora rubi]|uniref:Uncharacterized protein n=1 Tax=Phytophthora rubi TaxID=129364 RepID=A0A6A3FYJ6_9STRA|nr:hypothetical protein PR002_g33224 [Phytophthora rubi]